MNRAEALMRAHRASDEDVARLVLEAVARLRDELLGSDTCPLCHGVGAVESRRELA